MTTTKKIAIVLWVIQASAVIGSFLNNDYLINHNIFYLIGFFAPALIGLGLWFGKNRDKKG